MWYENNSQYDILEKKINAFEDITIKKSSKWSTKGEKAKEWLTEHFSYGGTSIAVLHIIVSQKKKKICFGGAKYIFKGKIINFPPNLMKSKNSQNQGAQSTLAYIHSLINSIICNSILQVPALIL